MRRLKRNQRLFAYQKYDGMVDGTDTNGFKNGRKIEQYEDKVYCMGCVVFQGSSSFKPYGVEEDFSLQIIPDNPIDINTKSKVFIFEYTDDAYADGGTFIPWSTLYELDGGGFDFSDEDVSDSDGGLFVTAIEYCVKSAPITMNEQRIFCK